MPNRTPGKLTTAASTAAAAAGKTDMQTPVSATLMVTPVQTQNHPGVAKVFVRYNSVPAAPSIYSSYGVTSLTKDAAGIVEINFTTAFASTSYCVLPHATDIAGPQAVNIIHLGTYTTSACTIRTYNSANTLTDMDNINVVIYGDQ